MYHGCIALRRVGYKSFFLVNSGIFSDREKRNSALNFGFLQSSKSLWPKFFSPEDASDLDILRLDSVKRALSKRPLFPSFSSGCDAIKFR